MFAINDTFLLHDSCRTILPTDGRRFYRGRNCLSQGATTWDTHQPIPEDPPFWDDLFDGSIRIGVSAAKRSMRPALCVWALMGAIAAIYYLVPTSHVAFSSLTAFQNATGILFPFFGMGLAVGLMAEAAKVIMSTDRKWKSANTHTAIFNFIMFGIMGITSYYRYPFQEDIFGTGNSWQVLASKVAFDQFIWTVIIANPYQALLYLWKNHHYSWREVTSQIFPFKAFWGTKMLPMLIANWAFWIPMATIVYCFPTDLQLPLSILAVAIWVIIISVMTSSKRDEA